MKRALPFYLVSLSFLLMSLFTLSSPSSAADYFLHTTSTDLLNITSPTATTAKSKDSPALNRTTFREIGVWSAAPVAAPMRLNSLSSIVTWIGLKNSDDQGTFFDLRAEISKNGVVIASGETKNIQGVTLNPNLAKEVAVAFGTISDPQFNSGDVLSIRILTNVADSGGHNTAIGLRMYYDAVSRPSRFGATFGPATPARQVQILSPASGSSINNFSILVIGEILVPPGPEIGVTVNGYVALIDGAEFAALVPVDQTVTSLTATVADTAGIPLGSHSIPITIQPPAAEPVLHFRPSPVIGAAPLTASFILSSLSAISNIALDANGDGAVDFNLPSLEGQSFVYNSPGLYYPKVTVMNTSGGVHTAEAIVQVIDTGELDSILQSKWTGMKNALRTGNTAVAANYIVKSKRANYQNVFNNLTVPLANIDQVLPSITFVEHRGLNVDYEMLRFDGADLITYVVTFVLDEDGVWRIKFF